MPEITHSYPQLAASDCTTNSLPISSIVRALCQAATTGPDLLYEVMLKLSLLVEATAPMYGLSIWSLENDQRPALEWAEGLQEAELATGEKVVSDTLSSTDSWPTVQEGAAFVCFVL